MLFNDALEALLTQILSGEGIPISVKVSPSDDIEALRARIAELEAEVDTWKKKLEVREYQYRTELLISQRLVDMLRDNDIKIPRWVFDTR